jgi:predicted ATPase
MGKLIVHVGNAKAVQMANVEVVGSLLSTPAEMSALGRSLRPSNATMPRQVFTNSDHVINGLRLAVKYGELNHENVEIRFHTNSSLIQASTCILLDADGNFDYCPLGFMDQASQDLVQLF